jgi:hypothetical protein
MIRKYVDELDRLEVPSHPPVDVFVMDAPIPEERGTVLRNPSEEIIDIDEYLEGSAKPGAISRGNGPDPSEELPTLQSPKSPLEQPGEDGVMRIAIPDQDLTKYVGVDPSELDRVQAETVLVETTNKTHPSSATIVQDEVAETVLAIPDPAVTRGKEYPKNDLQDWEVVSVSEVSPEAKYKKRILFVVIGTILVAAVITLVALLR